MSCMKGGVCDDGRNFGCLWGISQLYASLRRGISDFRSMSRVSLHYDWPLLNSSGRKVSCLNAHVEMTLAEVDSQVTLYPSTHVDEANA